MRTRLHVAWLSLLTVVVVYQVAMKNAINLSDITTKMLLPTTNETRHAMNSSGIPTIFVITPTYERLEQKADLTRLSNTLRIVPSLHWIIAEDSETKTSNVKNVLANSKIPSTHLNIQTPKTRLQSKTGHRGVLQRNTALDWIRRQHILSGVVYFADDDNTYDIRLFEEMRYTKTVSVWPVGLAGGLLYESPIVTQGRVTDWWSFLKDRTFATDMAGFAVSVKLLNKIPSVKFRTTAKPGDLENDFLKQLNIQLTDLEPKADGCTKVLVWHTKTDKTKLFYESGMLKLHGHKSNKTIEV